MTDQPLTTTTSNGAGPPPAITLPFVPDQLGAEPTADDLHPDPLAPPAPAAGARRRQLRTTAGRALIWLVLAVVAIRGILSIFGVGDQGPSPAVTTAVQPKGSAFPTQRASAWAVQATTAYLTWPESGWSASVNRYFPKNVDVRGLWDGAGIGQRTSTVVALETEATSATTGVVTVAARLVQPDETTGWVYLLVPVTVDGDAIALDGLPTFTGSPTRIDAFEPATAEHDTKTERAVAAVVEQWFTAYGQGDDEQLAYLLAPKAKRITGLGYAELASVIAVTVPETTKASKSAQVTVEWALGEGDGAAHMVQVYDLGLQRSDGRWYVTTLATAPGVLPSGASTSGSSSAEEVTTTTTEPAAATTTTKPRSTTTTTRRPAGN